MVDFWNPRMMIMLVIAILAVVSMMAVGIILVLKTLMPGGGGWSHLARDYRFDGPRPDGPVVTGETIKVGAVVYKRCATVGVGPRGLYLKAWFRGPVLVPWKDITRVTPASLYWQDAVCLTVGEPATASIVVNRPVFAAMEPYLRGVVPLAQADRAARASVET